MNWDRVQKNWPELKASVRTRWSKLTDEHLSAIEGKEVRRQQLVHHLRDVYGFDELEAESQVANWQASLVEPLVKSEGGNPVSGR